MKTKQIISIALMLALLVSVITGCGTKEDPSTNNNEESTSAVSSEIKENEESKSGSKTSAEKKTHRKYYNRRLRNATSRINTAFFVTYKQITPHRIWYNRVD